MSDPQKYFTLLSTLPQYESRGVVEYMAAFGSFYNVKMTDEIAESLHIVFERSKEFWITLDAHYQEWKEKQKEST